MSKRSDRMYSKDGKGSPTLKRDEKTGEMGVTRHKKEAQEPEKGTEGAIREGANPSEPLPEHVRHSMARGDLHKRHEAEHAVHDHHKAGDKSEMHARHEKELKALHAVHEKESAMKSEGSSGEKSKHEHEEKVDQAKKDGLLGEAKKVEKE